MVSLAKAQMQPAPSSQAEEKPVPAQPSVQNTGDAIAAMLIKAGHITAKQLTYAQRVQAKLSIPKTLLNILKELKYLDDEQLRETLSANPSAIRLGDLLVELGYIQ